MSRVNYQRIRARRRHAKQRAAQRYGLCLTTADLAAIVETIRDSQAVARLRISKNTSIQLVDHDGLRVAVLYSHRHHEIVTCLPMTDWRVERLMSEKGVSACV